MEPPDLYLLSQSTYIETNQMSRGSILIIGTMFSLLLLVIGPTNFANTMATNIYAVKENLPHWYALGMTKRKMFRTLSIEGDIYGLFLLLLIFLTGLAAVIK